MRPVALLLYSMVVGVACTGTLAASLVPGPAPQNPAKLVAMLQDVRGRDRAACRLFEIGEYRTAGQYQEERCDRVGRAVNHVVMAPQVSEPPFALIFRRWPFPAEHIGPGRPKGPLAIVDGSGRLVPVFAGANMLNEDDDVFRYSETSSMAIAHVIPYGGGEDTDRWTTTVLHIVPVDAKQEPVLSVVLGPSRYDSDDPCEGAHWTWRRRDLDADGVPEIEIGPRQSPPEMLPKAVYRWSRARSAYEGPGGAVEERFLRLTADPGAAPAGECSDPYWTAAAAWAASWRDKPVPRDPVAVRENRCSGALVIHF